MVLWLGHKVRLYGHTGALWGAGFQLSIHNCFPCDSLACTESGWVLGSTTVKTSHRHWGGVLTAFLALTLMLPCNLGVSLYGVLSSHTSDFTLHTVVQDMH